MVSLPWGEDSSRWISANVPNRAVGIGLGGGFTDVEKMPGWMAGSWGYHSDDGRKFSGSGWGSTYAQTFGKDDVVGCGIHKGDIYFTKNGQHLGMIFTQVR
jgi:hypothetical protein